MKMIPISSGFSPVFLIAFARAISAATSTGALIGRSGRSEREISP